MSLGKILLIFIAIIFIFTAYLYYEFYIRGNMKQGQPLLPTETVTIDSHTFSAEMAKTSLEQQMGLSDRSSMGLNDAMIFLFPQASFQSFWMKEMKFPLDIVFISNHKIVYIAQNLPTPGNKPPPIISPRVPSDTVLEINAGLSKQYHFKLGDTVNTSL